VEALEELLAKDAVLYADGGNKAIAPLDPLVGAALIARFMAGVAQVRRAFGEFETRLVRVNGQPGRLLRSPGEEPFGEAERLAAQKALALLKAGDLDPKQLATLMIGVLDRTRVGAGQQGQPRVRDVLTVDVVEGRIQTVRIVRNPESSRISELPPRTGFDASPQSAGRPGGRAAAAGRHQACRARRRRGSCPSDRRR
jgi:RNA polymerase sigma-70 factor, ECF subfamily